MHKSIACINLNCRWLQKKEWLQYSVFLTYRRVRWQSCGHVPGGFMEWFEELLMKEQDHSENSIIIWLPQYFHRLHQPLFLLSLNNGSEGQLVSINYIFVRINSYWTKEEQRLDIGWFIFPNFRKQLLEVSDAVKCFIQRWTWSPLNIRHSLGLIFQFSWPSDNKL